MPELPEVEVIRRGLTRRLVGRRFVAVSKGDRKLRQDVPLEGLQRLVTGRRLVKVGRRGKYLLLHLEGGAVLVIHLGMTGRLLICSDQRPPFPATERNRGHRACEPALSYDLPGVKTVGGESRQEWAAAELPHVHWSFQLEGDLWLLYQDVRRFGQVLVYPPGEPMDVLARLGREPFSPQVTPEWLMNLARGRRRPLKNFLLDGRIITGVGNIYACEIMFAARLHPTLPVGCLSRGDWQHLIKEMRRLLRLAIRRGGTTVNDYLNCEGQTGLFQLDLMVYGRAGEPCRKCGDTILRLVQGGRSTFFCPQCQPNRSI